MGKTKKIHQKINKHLNDPKGIFYELVYQDLYSDKFWENRFFLFCIPLVGPYGKPFLIVLIFTAVVAYKY